MLSTFIASVLILLGIWKFPIFTLGCVLIHYDHPVLGIIAIIVSILRHRWSDDDVEYID